MRVLDVSEKSKRLKPNSRGKNGADVYHQKSGRWGDRDGDGLVVSVREGRLYKWIAVDDIPVSVRQLLKKMLKLNAEKTWEAMACSSVLLGWSR